MESLLSLGLQDAYLFLIRWVQAHPICVQILMLNLVFDNHEGALVIRSRLQHAAIIGASRIRIDGIVLGVLPCRTGPTWAVSANS